MQYYVKVNHLFQPNLARGIDFPPRVVRQKSKIPPFFSLSMGGFQRNMSARRGQNSDDNGDSCWRVFEVTERDAKQPYNYMEKGTIAASREKQKEIHEVN